jgi:signal transduction histidine kinase
MVADTHLTSAPNTIGRTFLRQPNCVRARNAMTSTPAILLADSVPADRSLSMVLLQREFPGASVIGVPDAAALAEALLADAPDVALIASDLEWFNVSELMAVIKRRHPATGIVLFVCRPVTSAAALSSAVAIDGIVEKTSAGFLRLGPVVAEVLRRLGSHRPGRPEVGNRPINEAPAIDEVREAALMFSHDLREPIQQIIRLMRREPSSVPPGGRGLQHVLDCAERANHMLDGMVEYLGITAAGPTALPIDLNRCVAKAVDNLRSSINEAGAEIRAAPLPTIMGDERQVTHLFQNLISNAIKFRRNEPPVVTITAETSPGEVEIAVADNGIGLPEAFLERIFEIGARLHTREEYPGTGMGLALCRRIVERHGGRIWAAPRPDGGSVFSFRIPAVGSVSARLE